MSFDAEKFYSEFRDKAFKKYRIRIHEYDPFVLEILLMEQFVAYLQDESDQTVLMHEERMSDIAEKWQKREEQIAENFTAMLNRQSAQMDAAAKGVFKDAMQKAVETTVHKIRDTFVAQNSDEIKTALKWLKTVCVINVIAVTAGAVSLCCMLCR